jgi:hypothetical protein
MDKIMKLVDKTWGSCYDLTPRGRRARINLIWKDFVDRETRKLIRKLLPQPKRYPRYDDRQSSS